MRDKVTILVYGTGFAGQGHTEAFRYAGAEVVGICGDFCAQYLSAYFGQKKY